VWEGVLEGGEGAGGKERANVELVEKSRGKCGEEKEDYKLSFFGLCAASVERREVYETKKRIRLKGLR